MNFTQAFREDKAENYMYVSTRSVSE